MIAVAVVYVVVALFAVAGSRLPPPPGAPAG
jgi:hypothetical protein